MKENMQIALISIFVVGMYTFLFWGGSFNSSTEVLFKKSKYNVNVPSQGKSILLEDKTMENNIDTTQKLLKGIVQEQPKAEDQEDAPMQEDNSELIVEPVKKPSSTQEPEEQAGGELLSNEEDFIKRDQQ